MKESNVSNLTKALAMVSLLAPASAQPLGIGDVELHSALNQNLKAQIKLSVAAGENPADISVRLAPPEKFDQAGVPWNFFLSKIKFEPNIQADGSVIVKISSREALREPFLDFLLEVSWPQGSMTKEFTLLIDPPGDLYPQLQAASETKEFNAEPLPLATASPKPPRIIRSRASAPSSDQDISPQTPTDGEVGPIQKTDTLWSIAKRVGQERGVPTAQMLSALYKANPESFNGDINSLKEGAILKIPVIEPSQQPIKPSRKTQIAQNNAPVSTTTKALELVAPTETKPSDKPTQANLAKPGQHAIESGNGSSDTASEGKVLEMQAHIDKLEQQLTMMQQMLTLKDQQLAALQNTNKAAPIPETAPAIQPKPIEAPAVQSPNKPAEPATPAPQQALQSPASAPVTVTPPAEQPPKPAQTSPKTSAPPPPAATEEESSFADPYYLTIGGLGLSMLSGLGWLLWRKRKIDDRTNTETMFASASQIRLPDSESSLSVPIMDLTATEDYDVGTVGESSFISDFTPSDFDAFDSDQNEVDPISEADVYLAYGRYQQAEELIRHAIQEQPNRDECKLKLLEIFYASENKDDFASFAQELAAAGKQNDKLFWNKVSDMAKELVPELALFGGSHISTEPPRAATPAVNFDDDAFLQDLAQPIQSPEAPIPPSVASSPLDTGDNLAGNELDFDLSVFVNQSDTEKTSHTQTTAQQLDSFDLDFQLDDDEFAISLPPDEKSTSVQSNQADAIESIEFDFDLSSHTPPKSTSTIIAPADETQEIEDINLDDIESIDFSTLDVSIETKPEELPESIESFDFNFDTPLDNKEESILKDQSDNIDSPLALDFESFDFSSFAEEAPAPKSTTTTPASNDLDDFEFNFDFDTPISSTPLATEHEMDLGVSDLTDMDELETKIDLAKAYIDMGDAEAAKSIAQDVLLKGSKQQQQAAQELLDSLK